MKFKGLRLVVALVCCLLYCPFAAGQNANTLSSLRPKAEQGDIDAQYKVGVMSLHSTWLFDAESVDDYHWAWKQLEIAAKRGHPGANYEIARCYEEGNREVKKNIKKAVELYKKAVDLGSADAAFRLGELYRDGTLVKADKQKALSWFRSAAALGHKEAGAIVRIATLTERADVGDSEAMNSLGIMYCIGDDVAKDYSEGLKWLRKAVDLGNLYALNNLGNCYERGFGVSKDTNEAIRLYGLAADGGNQRAKDNLERLKVFVSLDQRTKLETFLLEKSNQLRFECSTLEGNDLADEIELDDMLPYLKRMVSVSLEDKNDNSLVVPVFKTLLYTFLDEESFEKTAEEGDNVVWVRLGDNGKLVIELVTLLRTDDSGYTCSDLIGAVPLELFKEIE